MVIIGITGTLGAGKGTIVDYLIKERSFQHYSVRAYLIEKIKEQGLPVNRDTMTTTANRIRKDHDPAYIIEVLYQKAIKERKNAIIESIRTPGEIEFLKKQGSFYLFAVDADPQVRYERIVSRASETDHVDFDTFLANEKREMTTTDPNKQNLAKCIELADFRINNNGSQTELYTAIDNVLKKMGEAAH
ncbi:MAG: AAA family ATPase [Bacteroidales bacterium]|nr:AAA family ATPase [Bacteroidales bacterium]